MGDFRRSQELMGDFIRESSMPEQHLKALSAAGRFNPLNRQKGISPDSVHQFWAGLLTLAPMIRNAPTDTV